MSAAAQPAVAAPAPAAAGVRRHSRWRGHDLRLVVGCIGLVAFVLAAALAGVLAPYAPDILDLAARLHGPSSAHLLGTDQLGRDILSRILYGLRPSLEGGLVAIVLAALAGTIVGVPAGYLGRWFDTLSTRAVDLLVAWPSIFLALAIVLIAGPGSFQVVIAIGLAELPVFARVVRSIAATQAASDHLTAARTVGASHLRIMRLHILPFVIAPVVVQLAISAPQAIVAEASLNYLGLGTQPPAASLGSMVSEGQDFLSLSSSQVVYPIAAIVVLVICLTLIADGLQDRLDPHRQKVRA
ncbi:MAG: ABC transporter permease [Solirubrobacteraceae bacterium]